MTKIFRMLDGRKTHIGVIVLTSFALLASLGVDVPPWLWTIVSGWTGVAITHKANKGLAAVREAATAARDTKIQVAGLRYERYGVGGGNGQAKT